MSAEAGSTEGAPPAPRARLGAWMIGFGVLLIVVGVIWMLEVANGPGAGPQEFAERRSYNQTKEAIHSVLPIGMAIAAAGLGLAMLGGHLRRPGAGESAG